MHHNTYTMHATIYHSCSNINYTNMTYFAKRQSFFLLFPLTWWIVDTHIDKRLCGDGFPSHLQCNRRKYPSPHPFKLKTLCKQKRRQFFTSRGEQMIETICHGFVNIRNLLSTAPSKKNVNSSFQTGLTSLSLVFVRLRPSGAVFIRRMRYGSGVSTVTNNINETLKRHLLQRFLTKSEEIIWRGFEMFDDQSLFSV